jgi:lysozyme family protein
VTFHTKLSTWGTFGKGWAMRLATVPFQAMRLSRAGIPHVVRASSSPM